MPWSPSDYRAKFNQRLTAAGAKQASAQANAILKKTGDEGMAIAVANKNAAGMKRKSRYGGKSESNG